MFHSAREDPYWARQEVKTWVIRREERIAERQWPRLNAQIMRHNDSAQALQDQIDQGIQLRRQLEAQKTEVLRMRRELEVPLQPGSYRDPYDPSEPSRARVDMLPSAPVSPVQESDPPTSDLRPPPTRVGSDIFLVGGRTILVSDIKIYIT